MSSTLWQEYRDKFKLMQATRGKCQCVNNTMGTWLRIRLGQEWYVATHMRTTADALTLLRYDSSGLQWQISNVPQSDNAMVRLVGVASGIMTKAANSTDYLATKLICVVSSLSVTVWMLLHGGGCWT